MLKKIAVQELRVGMHLHKLEGSWLSHAMWRTRFLIADAAELQRVRDCGVAECWIDTARGLDVDAERPAPAATLPVPVPLPASEPPATVAPAPPPPPPAPPAPRAMADELQQAATICRRGRAAVSAMFAEARMGRVVDVQGCLPLVDDITTSVQRNAGALVSLARLKNADDYSFMHSVAVCAMMVALARRLGWDDDACRRAGVAGLMHDIGKAVMPIEVLNKPGRLSDEEFTIIRSHPARGHAMLDGAAGVSPETLDVVLHHHERMDGTGYPHRLPGEQISVISRMGAICDVYDAITSNRPYKAGWDPADSIARMASWKGHFDTTLLAAFIQSLGIYPVGSVVRLESQRLAVVVEPNAQRPTAPAVKVFFSLRQQLHVTPLLLDLAAAGCSDRIVGRHVGGPGGGLDPAHIAELWAGPEALRRARQVA